MTNPVSYTYLWLPLIAYRSLDGFFVKAYEDQGYQEGTGSQEMDSFSTEAEKIPPWGIDDLTSPAFPSEPSTPTSDSEDMTEQSDMSVAAQFHTAIYEV